MRAGVLSCLHSFLRFVFTPFRPTKACFLIQKEAVDRGFFQSFQTLMNISNKGCFTTTTEQRDKGDNDELNLTRKILKAYVDEEGIRSYLTREGYNMIPFVEYVSYNKDGVLQILCCGMCPGCPAPHIRNVCNIQFCDMV